MTLEQQALVLMWIGGFLSGAIPWVALGAWAASTDRRRKRHARRSTR